MSRLSRKMSTGTNSPLSYLLVLQSAGLPLYAQSFEFKSDDACQSFNQVIKPTQSTKDAHLMGGYFNAMQLFGDDMIQEKLNLIDLGFTNFEILGVIKDDVFFIGIFQHFPESKKNTKIEFLTSIATQFLQTYPMEEIQDNFVSHVKFEGFTDIIMELSRGEINVNNCRNCLTKCTTENKGCLPHRFYFETVDFEDHDGVVLLKGDSGTS